MVCVLLLVGERSFYMIIYGSSVCPSTVEALKLLKEKNISFEYKDFCENIKALKEFIVIRDENSIFDSIKTDRKIGIPFFVLNNGIVTLDVNMAIKNN